MPHGRFIFHEKQGFRSAGGGICHDGFFEHVHRVRRLFDPWKIDFKRRAFPRLALDVNEAAALLDDGLARRQPQSRALAFRLGGVKRLEQMQFDLVGHTGSRVAHGKRHIIAGVRARVREREIFIERDVGGFDFQFAAVGHGVARVDDEVHQQLPDEAGIGLDPPGISFGNDGQLDIFIHQPPQHFIHVFDVLVKFKHHRLHHLLAAEQQKLPRQRRRPLRRVPDFLGAFVRKAVGGKFRHHEIVVADDDAKDVVEIVRDAAGEMADHLHLLRLDEL